MTERTAPRMTRRELLDLLGAATTAAILAPIVPAGRAAGSAAPTKRWLNHYVDVGGTWNSGQSDKLDFEKVLEVGGLNVRLHETSVGGMVVLSPNTGETDSYGEAEVYLRINYVGGAWEYLSAPLGTTVDLEDVDSIELHILFRVSDGRATSMRYRALVNAHCVYELADQVDGFLFDHSTIASAIEWETPSGFVSFRNWTIPQKDELRGMVRQLQQGGSPMLVDPPPNIKALGDDDWAQTVVSADNAWRLYVAGIAQSLYLELDRKLGWSLTGYSSTQLRYLLSSKWLLEWSAADGGYSLMRTRFGGAAAGWPDRGWAVPAPPAAVYQFLTSNNLVAADRLQTTANVVEWCRQNLVHFVGSMTAVNAEAQWQYRGLPPVSRMFAGTLHTGYPTWGVQKRTGGCHGTNGFLTAVLRVVNIPVLYNSAPSTGHAMPHFVADGRYLSHGDDPYNGFARGTPPPYPASELLIDQAQYDAWFGAAVPAATRQLNVGRRVYELALVHLTSYLLTQHCQDLTAGRNHAASTVAASFNRWYTVADLEAINLWTRMDQRLTELGGCGSIP